ncbi:nucleotidyltransferase domain-containing protein [bacterium]|nr:nucleotidyltransferase domain-containing protein [bacterium]
MEIRKILEVLRVYKKEAAKRYEILAIGLFGSVARGEAGANSDVDIVVRISEPDLFMLAGIKSDLEERLHQPVDLVAYTDGMNRFLKERINGEAVYA